MNLPVDDPLILEQARRGDAESFGVLVRTHTPRVYSFLVFRVGCRSDAEDLSQETFARAWRAFKSYDSGIATVRTWLLTIASRLAANHLRDRAAELRGTARAYHTSGLRGADRLQSTFDRDAATLGERVGVWDIARSKLDATSAELLYLRYVEELEPAEIAAAMDHSSAWVRVRLLRAKQSLRALLKQEARLDLGNSGSMPRALSPVYAETDVHMRGNSDA